MVSLRHFEQGLFHVVPNSGDDGTAPCKVEAPQACTEAAAATAIVFAPTSARLEPEEPAVFRADHPFVFTLRDNRSGAILFAGRVTNPK